MSGSCGDERYSRQRGRRIHCVCLARIKADVPIGCASGRAPNIPGRVEQKSIMDVGIQRNLFNRCPDADICLRHNWSVPGVCELGEISWRECGLVFLRDLLHPLRFAFLSVQGAEVFQSVLQAGNRMTWAQFKIQSMRAKVLIVCLCFAALSAAVWRFAPLWFTRLFVVTAIPVFAALVTTFISYYTSGYRKVIYEYVDKRRKERQSRAGLAFIRSKQGTILMNFQCKPPWQDMWLPLGGYFKPGVDRDTLATVERRVETLTGGALKVRARARIAYTKDDWDYEKLVLEWGHVPIHDDVYSVEKPDGTEISEVDIAVSEMLKWWKVEDIKSSRKIPPLYKDILLYLGLPGKEKPQPPLYWVIDDQYFLQTLTWGS